MNYKTPGAAEVKLEDKLYWGRFLGGILMGVLTEVLKLYKQTSIIAIIIAALAYIVSAIVIRSLLSPEKRAELGRKLYLSGSGTYAAVWLLSWIMAFNLLEQPLAV